MIEAGTQNDKEMYDATMIWTNRATVYDAKNPVPRILATPRHCPACSGQSRGTSGIAFIISTSDNRTVPFVPLDPRLRRG